MYLEPPFQKHPDEEFHLNIDYSENLFGGTVSSAVCTSYNYFDPSEDTSADIIDGVATVASPIVRQKFVGGLDGEIHVIVITVTMSGGEIVVDKLIVSVIE